MRAVRCLLTLGLIGLTLGPQAARAQSLDRLGPQAGPWRAALILAHTKESELAIDPGDERLYVNPRYRLPIHDLLRADPWRCGPFARSVTDQLLAQADDPTELLFLAESNAGYAVGNAVLADAVSAARARVRAGGDSSLAVALSELAGRPVSEFLQAGDYRLIPPVARDAAALMVFEIADALRDRDRALAEPLRRAGLTPQAAWQLLRESVEWHPEELPPRSGRGAQRATGERPVLQDLSRVTQTESMLDAVDLPGLYTGANKIAAGAKRAIADLRAGADRMPPRDFRYAVSTPSGWVMVLGGGQHHHRGDERHLLILDLGGDDVYANAGNTLDVENPVSVVIDLAGNDEYRTDSAEQPAFGAGIGGYGMLFDLAGNDLYSSPVAGQGCGILGVGLLYDAAGDDRYQADRATQGCGVFGIGALVDLAGNDQYDAGHAAQGYGYTLGCGLLVDSIGDDRYTAYDAGLRYPYAPGHSASLAQGYGCGRQGGSIDGHDWAGGVGILVDGAGLDRYNGDVLCQGGACAGGVGILADKMGADEYTGFAASLAAALTGGVAIVQDDAGDDLYRGGGVGLCGYARDFGVAWFEDGGGNDRYLANESAFGVGDENGLGLFWDRAGNDLYVACNASFGIGAMDDQGTVRDLMLDAGFFVDGAGVDRYYQLPPEEREKLPFNFRTFTSFEAYPGMGDGTQLSRYDLLRHPGSTGAAVDVE